MPLTPAEEDMTIVTMMCNPQQVNAGFRLLIKKYQERLYYHVLQIVKVHEDSDDVLQNVFIKVFRNIQGFEAKSGLYTWLYRIATNEALTHLQGQKRRMTDDLEPLSSVLETGSQDGNLSSVDLEKLLKYAMSTLPEKQKLVFHMRYYDEMPYEDISKVLETSVGALKASNHHAVKKIEAIIKRQDLT